ncbi:4Fe-4S cluster-binding domain-containing protein [Enterococcus sp. AZ109]|uniref:4Fe-4S cluster-binding domain-containing protein n=1 Tax=Enterococcus sp. AZ109 TaxID=2774634 RepID=UPI003F24ADBB
METGTVLRIEKSSIYDGEGLRTVVYLKGCPLRCKWCSTPESQNNKIEKGFGSIMTSEDVIKEVEKDAVFYLHSGGGVTISGGEALVQADFAQEILKKARYSGINTALETSFYADYQEISKVGSWLNAIYVDLKFFDSLKHQKWTGVSNLRIKENLKRFVRDFPECALHIRIPVIPTVNLDLADLTQSAKFVAQLRGADLELLPYHRYGLQSYRQLGKTYELAEIQTPDETVMIDLTQQLARINPGLPVMTMEQQFVYSTPIQ